ncbi:MAG: GNAT family N-acetyltransferase [Leptolyngbyaceae cyanobacterium SM1_3_5]|nr:GNAT family N-acetyltransferase [Leptolyngbyaceae cyanobacterium SM1_3_5]
MTTQAQPIVTDRSYANELDLQAIADLINACELVDQLEQGASVEELQLRFADPDFDLAHDLRLWEDAQGSLIGSGWMWIPPATDVQDGYLGFKVHPQFRNRGIEVQILTWAEARMRSIALASQRPIHLRAGAREHQAERIALLEQQGFTINRYFYDMALPLSEPLPALQLPAGYGVRSLHSNEVEAWVELFNQSFIDHWNFHPVTLEQRQRWMSDPDYCADLDLVAVSPEGTLAAFCHGAISSKDNARTGRSEGWISGLGTRRGFRRIGLGRAMLLCGLAQLQAKGIETALLGVDSQNPSGALRLYESVGFRKRYTNITYCKVLVN